MIDINLEAGRCLICENAPCSAACKKGDPARAVRAIRFGNASQAGRWFSECSDSELLSAEKACLHYDFPIRLREISKALQVPSPLGNVSLETGFCGLRCENPFFLASSAICTNYEMVASAFDAGWAGVFYKTICLEKIDEVSPRFDAVKNTNGTFAGFRNMEQLSENPPEVDFGILSRLKENYPSKIVVASIMGKDDSEWIKLARMAQEAGADAVELNFSCPQMKYAGMGSDVGQSPELVAFYTSCVKNNVSIPVITKMTPNLSSMTEVSIAAHSAGADAISAINTIKSLTMGGVVSGRKMVSGYSGVAVKPISLHFILQLTRNSLLEDTQICGIGGIYTWKDAADYLKLGCRCVQVCTAVMEYGYRIIDDLVLGLKALLTSRGLSSVTEIIGEEKYSFFGPEKLDRATKVFPTVNKEACIGCGRCYRSCQDGGHQAVVFGEDRVPKINGKKCVGCHLCLLVCPVGAIGEARRIPK